MNRTARLLTILNLIRTKRHMNALYLAKECNVTERTIYRDISTLSEAGAPVYYDKGYKLLPGTFLPPLNLSTDEYLTLKIVLTAVPFSQFSFERINMQNLMMKIDCAVNSTIPDRLKKSPARQEIRLKTTMKVSHSDPYLKFIRKAIDSDMVLQLDYDSISSGKSTRRVDPYFLVFRGRAYYLIGYCHSRGELRLFRIDRISNLNVVGQVFERDHSVTPQKFFENSWDVFTGEPVDVKICLTGEAAQIVLTGQHHPTEKIVKLNDGAVEYQVTVAGIDEIARWIIGFGRDATVISPPELAKHIQNMAHGVLDNYR